MEGQLVVKTMAEFAAENKSPEIIFWVGCAGSFDDKAKKVTRSFAKILNHLGIEFAVLGKEEGCTGDPAKRAGNEFLFQMQAMQNIEVLNAYEIKKIVTTCPHCFNTLKNEYPALGGNYDVVHHSQYLNTLIQEGKLKVKEEVANTTVSFHDPCYLGRANEEYLAPRQVLNSFKTEVKELKRCKTNSLCCGAGGAQMFKEAEKGDKEINIERSEEIIENKTDKVIVGCPFCKVMISDGVTFKEKQSEVQVIDLAEHIVDLME